MENVMGNSEAELLPCPFCGHDEPVLVIGLKEHRGYGVRCGKGRCRAVLEIRGETKSEAITAWNTRHQSETGAALPSDGGSADCELNADLCARITEYLCAGGLVNPELMDHKAVRDLLVDIRDALRAEHRAAKAHTQVGE
jgi:hypothetical protein